jgi:gluconate 2-dehydrogenase gamma chain
MEQNPTNRRHFLKGALVGSAVAVGGVLPNGVHAESKTAVAAEAPNANRGYLFLNLEEQSFIESVVDHMIPADALSPKGTEIGINIYIDRALANGWGKGERLYNHGPWKKGLPTQGYQLSLTPAELYRVCITKSNLACINRYGKAFDQLSGAQRQEFLVALSTGKVEFIGGPSSKTFFDMLYQNVMEGMFSDPIYGGNQNKAGWKLIGFPGAISLHAQDVETYLDKKYTAPIFGISDLS